MSGVGSLVDPLCYALDLAEDGQAGLAVQRAQPADLIITDIFMSGDSKLVKHSAHFLTAREMGVHGALAKPFDEDELLRVIRDALK